MAHSPGLQWGLRVGTGCPGLGDSVSCWVELQGFASVAGCSGSQPESRAMAFSACSGTVLGTPCYMVKHVSL